MSTISPNLFSQRSPIREAQAQLMARLIRMLEAAVNRGGRRTDTHEWLYELPEYQLCVQGAYAAGFVCRDFSIQGIDLDAIASRPEMLTDVPLQQLRRYVHVLMRAERSNHPWASCILEAIKSGALGLVARRLESDGRLCTPEQIEEE